MSSRLTERSVIDAHFHLWRPSRLPYPWLAPGSPRPALGDHTPLMRDYTFADHARDIGSLVPLVGGVHVEANCADPLAEATLVSEEAARIGLPLATVVRVDLTRANAPDAIARAAGLGTVRGVRMRLNADPRIARAGIADEPAFRANFAHLDRHGLLFELSIHPPQSDEGTRLADDFPHTSIVLDHIGWPRIADGTDSFATWRTAMERLAARPNISVKLSMLFPVDRAWRRAAIEPFVLETLALFGTDRVMFGSNYPIETVMGSPRDQLATLFSILAPLSASEQDAILCDTAARVFRLGRHLS